MLEIKPISSLTIDSLERIIPGYTSNAVLEIQKNESDTAISFSFREMQLREAFVKKHSYSDPVVLEQYNKVMAQGHSYGAFLNGDLTGFIICEIQRWNTTLVVREFGVSPDNRKKGIGRLLFEKAESVAHQNKLRGILCETQSSNMPAIRFYKRFGFKIEGFDLSLYSNEDFNRGEIAIFLRKAISVSKEL